MEPSSHAHIIGFPYQANSVKNDYDDDSSSGGGGKEKKKQDIEARQKSHLASIYKPL